ncbi:MAG: GNAT family N-acetyltransferase [Mycobacterium sp.]|nr:GNAT family N-acetyltransferase [Mycobacterium sp.]
MRFVEYSDDALPAVLKWQVLSFLRIVFPDGFVGPDRYRDWITQPKHQPYHLLYVANDLVVSHVEIVRRQIDHGGATFAAYAPTGVLTFPTFRREGWAGALVRKAVDRIEASDADLGLICCAPENVDFYVRNSGWKLIPGARILAGETRAAAEQTGQSLVAEFLTEKARRCRDTFVQSPLWVGDEL